METKNTETKSEKQSREVDLVGLAKKVFGEKKTLLAFVTAFSVLGVVIALGTPKSYTSNVVMAPEISSAGNMAGNLSDLASMVGVNLSSQGGAVDAIYPEIYPDVLASSDFIVGLFNVKVRLEKDSSERTYYEHILKDTPIPFWERPFVWIASLTEKGDGANAANKKVNTFRLTKQQYAVYNTIRANLSCNVDKKTSIISLGVQDYDRLVAATIADTIQVRLQQYITLYRTQKARNDLAYTKKLFSEAKANYIRSQQKYGSYADANEDLVLQSVKNQRDAMENEMQLRFNIYTQLSQRLQLAEAKVQERTPVFTVIQGASVPLLASSTPRSYIVLLFVFLGVLADAAWVLFLRKRIQERRGRKRN